MIEETEQIRVSFDSGGVGLVGHLHCPTDATGKVPCVVMGHGFSGTQDRLFAGAERFAAARKAGGHAVDLWGSAVDVVERMGILPEVEAARTRNDASSLIRLGKPPIDVDVSELAVEFSDRAVEIPRDELTRLLYRPTSNDVEYIFGDSIAALEEDADGVWVTFQHSAPRRFDLVVGADGLHSRVRRLAFGTEGRFPRYLGGPIAAYTVPNFLGLDGRILTYSAVDRTVVVYPVGQSGDARALFMFRRAEEIDYDHHDVEQQKRLLCGAYAAGGDHAAGFRNYEDEIRDTIARSRAIGPALLKTLIPTSRAQIWLGMQVARLLPRLPKRLKRSVSLFPREAVQGMRSIASLPLEDD